MAEKIFIAGKLSEDYKNPILKLGFVHHDTLHYSDAIIDTGAYHCLMHESLIQDLKLHISGRIIPQDHPVLGAVPLVGYYAVFCIEGYTTRFNVEFFKMPAKYQYPVIIGTEFLSQMESLMYFGKEERFELLL